MVQRIFYACLTLLLLMLPECTLPSDQNSISTVTTQQQITFNCEFLTQPQADGLLNATQQYASLNTAIADVYGITEEAIALYPGTSEPDQPGFTRRWFSADPFFGEVQYFAESARAELLGISVYSVNEKPPPFALQEVIDCLGEPTSHDTFDFVVDADTWLRFPEAVNGFSLIYNDLDLTVMLLSSDGKDSLKPESMSYLYGIHFYPIGSLE